MKIEIEIYDIPKDKYGFFDEDSDLYQQLPILLFDGNEIDPCVIDEVNYCDTLSCLNKSRYKHYIKLSEIKLVKED